MIIATLGKAMTVSGLMLVIGFKGGRPNEVD